VAAVVVTAATAAASAGSSPQAQIGGGAATVAPFISRPDSGPVCEGRCTFMATRSRTTFKKRQKEMARMEKQRDKAAKRAQKKDEDRPSGPEVMSLEEAEALRS